MSRIVEVRPFMVNFEQGTGGADAARYGGRGNMMIVRIRTDDGLEGWASAEYLRWHSDGVRLEE